MQTGPRTAPAARISNRHACQDPDPTRSLAGKVILTGGPEHIKANDPVGTWDDGVGHVATDEVVVTDL